MNIIEKLASLQSLPGYALKGRSDEIRSLATEIQNTFNSLSPKEKKKVKAQIELGCGFIYPSLWQGIACAILKK